MLSHFLITMDVEGDNVWARPKQVETRNAAYLARFQTLCEKYGLKPTYLTNHEMALSPVYQEFAKDVVRRRTGEVGMHLHAWDTPPHEPLTSDDHIHQPYLVDYPDSTLRRKVRFMTDLLESTFHTKMVSHRAGRWAFNGVYARALVEHGYLADCSVTPHVSWRSTPGAPNGLGGTDYSHAPERPYFVDFADVVQEGDSPLLEVPMTVIRHTSSLSRISHAVSSRVGRRARAAINRLVPSIQWLRPNGRNVQAILNAMAAKRAANATHIEFMLHSSELMPGGSPTFRTRESIDHLYSDMEQIFAATRGLVPSTVAEFRAAFVSEAFH